jgi:hypothetical protein
VSSNGVLVQLVPQDGVILEHRGGVFAAGFAAGVAAESGPVKVRRRTPKDTSEPRRRAMFIDTPFPY